jgi:hypothetical protein
VNLLPGGVSCGGREELLAEGRQGQRHVAGSERTCGETKTTKALENSWAEDGTKDLDGVLEASLDSRVLQRALAARPAKEGARQGLLGLPTKEEAHLKVQI